MDTAEPPQQDALGVAEFTGTTVLPTSDGYELVATVDATDGTEPRVHLLAAATTAAGDLARSPFARAGIDAAAERIARAGNLQSPVTLRGAIEQALLQVERQGITSPTGERPVLSLLGLSLAGTGFNVARTPEAMAYLVDATTTERIFTSGAGDGVLSADGLAGPASPGTAPGIDQRRGQLEAGDRLVLMAGPGWKNVDTHRIGALVRSADPQDAAIALAQLAGERADDPVAVAVVAPLQLRAARGARPAASEAEIERAPAASAVPVAATGLEPGGGVRSAAGGSTGAGRSDAGGVGYMPRRPEREPISWLNMRWASAILAAFLVGGLLGAVVGDQTGRAAAPPTDPLNDRYVELVAQLYQNNEDPGMVQSRLQALGPAGEPDVLRRLAATYDRSPDPNQKRLSKAIFDLADLAQRGPLPVQAPAAAAQPATGSPSPSPVAGAASPVATQRPVTTATPATAPAPGVAPTQRAASLPTAAPGQPTPEASAPEPTSEAQPSPTPAARRGRIGTAFTEAVNMRNQPRRTGQPVLQVRPGTEIEILDSAQGEAVNPGNTTWYYVRVNGVEGYIYSSFVTGG